MLIYCGGISLSNSFYNNLLKATDNTDDISVEKYAQVLQINTDGTANVKDQDNTLTYYNVPVINNNFTVDDYVVIGFLNNKVSDPIIYGGLKSQIVTTIDSNSDDLHVPSAKTVYNYIQSLDGDNIEY